MARLIMGSTDVATAGTQVQISNTEDRIIWGVLKGQTGNTGNVAFGDSAVSMADGYVLAASAERELNIPQGYSILLNALWVDAATNGDNVDWVFLLDN